MTEEQLTAREKSVLLGSMDKRELGDYDEEFYDLLVAQRSPGPDEMDDRIRRAILRFISDFSRELNIFIEENKIGPKAARVSQMLSCLLIGYELGRKLQKPLTRTARKG